jgi:structural maintenance of chromosome 4
MTRLSTSRVAPHPPASNLRRIHMPPRRSTRSSARQSAEPESNTPSHKQAPSSKRKRSSSDNTDIQAQEDSSRPPSRTTRRPSSKATPSVPASRASSRQKSVSHQERDSDDEDGHEELSHPTKRSRPSYDLDDVHEEDEEEDVKPAAGRRTRRAASRPATRSVDGKTGKDQVALPEDEAEEPVTAKPISRAQSSRPSTSRRSGRTSRLEAVNIKVEPVDEPIPENSHDIDGGKIGVPATFHRKATKRSSRKLKSPSPSIAKEDSGDDTNVGECATVVIPNGSAAPDLLAEQYTPVPSPKKLPSITPPVHEEEKSLLDDLPTSPSKAKRGPPPLDEPQGPRPRLVIHKLALVNFKSYAGRQEIGPFHKVGRFRVALPRLIICSLSRQLLVPMVLVNQILSMHYFLCLVTALVRCDKENFPNSYTTLHNTRICKSVAWKFISARLSTLYVIAIQQRVTAGSPSV